MSSENYRGMPVTIPDSMLYSSSSSIQPALIKLIEIVEEENFVLERHKVVSHSGYTDRKNHALRELMAAQRFEGSPARIQTFKPLLSRLSSALKVNASLLKLHISAVGEISDIIVESLREADSDGTYSRGMPRGRR